MRPRYRRSGGGIGQAVGSVSDDRFQTPIVLHPPFDHLLGNRAFAQHRPEQPQATSKLAPIDAQRAMERPNRPPFVAMRSPEVPRREFELVQPDARPVPPLEQEPDDEIAEQAVDKRVHDRAQGWLATDPVIVAGQVHASSAIRRLRVMPSPFPNLPHEQRGVVRVLRHTSEALRSNPWRDPFERDVHVYVPPGYDDARTYPAVLLLAGYAGTGEKFLARGLSEVSIASRIDRLLLEGCPPFIAVLPDVMTTLGGSQYVDSPGLGNYATWLARELPDFVGTHLRIGRWGVVGKSSGGFGAIHLALEHPGVFEAVACHSGDMGFDRCYLGDLVPAVRAVQAAGGLDRFVQAFWTKHDPSGLDFAALNLLCMACAYSPDPTARPIPARLPVDFVTGRVDFATLESWARWDPLRRNLEPLRCVRFLYLDCGDRDEHLLHLGGRELSARLRDLAIPHEWHEFPGGHRGTSHRYDVSLPQLAEALS